MPGEPLANGLGVFGKALVRQVTRKGGAVIGKGASMTGESKTELIRKTLEEFLKRPKSAEGESRIDDHLSCSFCGKPQTDVQKLIAGPNAHICNECVRLCVDILKEEGFWPDQT